MIFRRLRPVAVVIARLGHVCCTAQGVAIRGPGYLYYVTGNAADVVRPTSGLSVLQGGGGDFVVLRASGDDAYNEYVYQLCNCDSVATIGT